MLPILADSERHRKRWVGPGRCFSSYVRDDTFFEKHNALYEVDGVIKFFIFIFESVVCVFRVLVLLAR